MSIADKLTQIAENEQRVYNAGYEKGIQAGGSGGDNGYAEGYAKGYEVGLADGETKGQAAGYKQGYNVGLAEGDSNGYTRGYNEGYSVGYAEGLAKGRTEGRAEGYTEGYTAGETAGYSNGHTEGYNEGKTDGHSEGYTEGKADGYEEGFEAGKAEGGDTEAAYNEGVEAGKQAEYDAFWDAFQKNGTEYIHYGYAFANKDLWTQEAIEKIKYKRLLANYFSVVFSNNTSITDLSAFSLETGNNGFGAFNRLGFSSTFNGCTNLKKCMPINCRMVYSFTNAFNGCTALEELILSGTNINSGLDLKWSKKLNKASLISVINCLEIDKTGQSVTLSLTAVNNAFETSSGAADGSTSAEWTALVATRPTWTISLADA